MRSLRLAGAAAFALVVVGIPVSWGCGGDAFTAGPADGGDGGGPIDGPSADRGGSDGDAAMSSDATDASDGPVGPAGKTVYVSASSGDDTHDGLDRSRPKKTIVSALGEASKLGAGAEVHVCAGTYVEAGLQLDFDVGLYGGWDCATWQRPADYGFPTFDTAVATIVQFAPAGAQQATLSIAGNVTSATTVDGFEVEGATSSSQTSVGVDIAGSASPVLSNDAVTGGVGKPSGPAMQRGSVGVRIVASGAPEVKSCVIDGGSGTGSVGSTGILVATKGLPKIHDDVVFGGSGGSAATGNGAVGAIGVDIESAMTGTNGLSLSTIAGSDTAGANGSSVGVSISGSGVSADVVGCDIEGGTGSASGTASAAVEVNAPGGTVNLVNDRLWGGVRGESSQTYGVLGQAAAQLSVANSEVHAGSVTPGSGGAPVGVYLAAVPSSAVVFDTIYTGATGAAVGVKLAQGASGCVIADDLLFGGGAGIGDAAIVGATCTGQLSALDYTGFADVDTLYACGSGATTATATSPTALAALVGVDTTGDVEAESSSAGCSANAWCIKDPSCPSSPPAGCVQSILGSSWTATDDGIGGLYGSSAADAGVTTPAWEIASPGACKLTGGGTPVKGITTDLLGKMRDPNHPTMGAVEYGGAPCTN